MSNCQKLLYEGLSCTNARKYIVSRKGRKKNRLKTRKKPGANKAIEGRSAPDFVTAAILEIDLLLNEKEKQQCDWSGRHEHGKGWWNYGYVHWNDFEFRQHLKMERGTFEFLLATIRHSIKEEKSELNSAPTSADRKLALTVYRLVHGCSFLVIQSLFGIHESLASFIFDEVTCVLVRELYDDYVRLPTTTDEWETQLHGYLKHHEFPCVGVWTATSLRFRTHRMKAGLPFTKVNVKLTCIALVAYDGTFLDFHTGTPGNIHDAKVLRNTALYKNIATGGEFANKRILLTNSGQVPLVTLGSNIFPRYPWLLKKFEEPTEPSQCNFNDKFSRASKMAASAHEMLSGRFRILVNKSECSLKKMKYIVWPCVLLHNLCTRKGDGCRTKWKVDVDVDEVRRQVDRNEDKKSSLRNCGRISKWMWDQNSYYTYYENI